MCKISYRRHRFPPIIIQHAVWLYCRFTLSYRDVEDLLAERGLDLSYETVRRWVLKFGRAYARRIQRRRPRPTERWHLDEMVVVIRGRRYFLWRAVDSEGEVLDFLIQSRRNTKAAIRLMRKLLKKQGFAPSTIVTDKLSFRAYPVVDPYPLPSRVLPDPPSKARPRSGGDISGDVERLLNRNGSRPIHGDDKGRRGCHLAPIRLFSRYTAQAALTGEKPL